MQNLKIQHSEKSHNEGQSNSQKIANSYNFQ